MTQGEVRSWIETLPGFAGWQQSSPDEANFHCPALEHPPPDKNPSCTVNAREQVFQCHKPSCDAHGKLWQFANLCGVENPFKVRSSPEAAYRETTYDYHSDDGEMVYQTVRYYKGGKKQFYQRRPDGGGWINEIKSITHFPYRLIQLLDGLKKGNPIIVCEGEKDAETVVALGYTATCNHGGAGKWRDHHTKWIPPGTQVYISPHADTPGQQHVDTVAKALTGNGCTVKILDFGYPIEDEHGKDVSDWIGEGHTKAEFEELLQQAKDWGKSENGRRIFTRLGDIGLTRPEWLIGELIEKRSVGCIFGPPGTFKSFLAIDWACRVATGSLFGERTVSPGPVLYIAGEGHAGLKRRFTAWEIRNQTSLENTPVYLSRCSVPLGDADALAGLTAEIKALSDESGNPVFIVIDTLSRNLGGDENSSVDMPRFVTALDQIRDQFGSTIHVIHHTPHSTQERSRGHSAFNAALDWSFRCERSEQTLRVYPTKIKDAEEPEPMQFTLRKVELEEPQGDEFPLTSCVLDLDEYEPPTDTAPKASGKWQTKCLSVLVSEMDRHIQNVVDSGRDPEEALVTVDTWRDACMAADVPRNRFYDAKVALVEKGVVAVRGGCAYVQ